MNDSKRESLNARKLKAPLMSFSINEEIERLKKEPSWIDTDRNAITLQKNSNVRVVLITLHKSAIMQKHKVEGPITLFVLSGKIIFSVDDEKINAGANELIVLEKTIPHNVEALEDTAIILTIIQPK